MRNPRKTSQALKDLYNISISHQQIANYCKTSDICIKPFVAQYPTKKMMSSLLMKPTSKSVVSKPMSG
jgi:hypothetical protein